MIDKFLIEAGGITKYFSYGRYIFKDINLTISNGDCIAITGENGSGKSTLIKILSHIIQPSSGKIQIKINEKLLKEDDFFHHFGFVSPYLILYEEFSPVEHFKITEDMKSVEYNEELALDLLRRFKLLDKMHEHIRTYSSGMKQRIKYIQALLGEPKVLFLDEPFTNLDSDGIEIVREIMRAHLEKGGALVIASNDERETFLQNSTIFLSGNNKGKN